MKIVYLIVKFAHEQLLQKSVTYVTDFVSIFNDL